MRHDGKNLPVPNDQLASVLDTLKPAPMLIHLLEHLQDLQNATFEKEQQKNHEKQTENVDAVGIALEHAKKRLQENNTPSM